MMLAADADEYFGFDLFESGTEDDDRREFNAKKRVALRQVSQFLRQFPFDHELYRGNSRQTLPKFLAEHGENCVDFAFIDGGHSVATIASDWQHVKRAVKPSGVVVFDDYYTDGPDTNKVGCNQIVEKLKHDVLAGADPVLGGGRVHLVTVTC